MSTVPNYVGTSAEVQGTNNVEAVGQNIATKPGPKHVHYVNTDKVALIESRPSQRIVWRLHKKMPTKP